MITGIIQPIDKLNRAIRLREPIGIYNILYPSQKRFVLDLSQPTTIYIASPKVGKTQGALLFMFGVVTGQIPAKMIPLNDTPDNSEYILEFLLKGENIYWFGAYHSTAMDALSRFQKLIIPYKNHNLLKWKKSSKEFEHIHFTEIDVKVFFVSGVNPNSVYGREASIIFIDEASRYTPDFYAMAFSIISKTNGRCIMFGNYYGENNQMQQMANDSQRVTVHQMTAQDGVNEGILSLARLEQIRQTMDLADFERLYYLKQDKSNSKRFFSLFDEETHTKEITYSHDYLIKRSINNELWLSFDFGVTMCGCIIAIYNKNSNTLEVIDEVISKGKGLIHCLNDLILKYKNIFQKRKVFITGDVTGNTGKATNPQITDYRIIAKAFREHNLRKPTFKVPSGADTNKIYRERLNVIFGATGTETKHPIHCYINKECKLLIRDLNFVECTIERKTTSEKINLTKTGKNSISKNVKNDDLTHLGDMFKYLCTVVFRKFNFGLFLEHLNLHDLKQMKPKEFKEVE